MKQIKMILTALAVVAMLFGGACDGCNSSPKKQYEIKYIVNMMYPDNETSYSGVLPFTEKVDEGTLYVTKNKFGTQTNTNCYGVFIGPGLVPIEGDFFDLGYKKFTVNKSVTIHVSRRDAFLFAGQTEVYYVAGKQNELESKIQFFENADFPYSVKIPMPARIGEQSVTVTEWRDDLGNVYTAAARVITADKYKYRKFLILYPNKYEAVNGKILTYDKNGATSGNSPSPEVYTAGNSATILANSGNLKKTGYLFMGWNTKANGSGTTYTAGQPLVMSQDTILYAKWGKSVSVNFDPNSPTTGTAPAGTVTGNSTYIVPGNTGNLTKTGFTFGGWNTKKDGTGYTYAGGSSLLLVNNVTLFAKWDAQAVSGIEIKTVNNLADATIDASHKLHWFVTTDILFFNEGAVVTNGTLASVSETKKVTLPNGKYYVWGFIDKDGNGARSAGDYGAMVFATVGGYYVGDFYSMMQYQTNFVQAFDVTSSSGHLPATIKFVDSISTKYAFPAQEAIFQINYRYTGAKPVSESHYLSVPVKKNVSQFATSDGIVGGYWLQVSDKDVWFVIRATLNDPYYFAAFVDSDGDGDAGGFAPESGDPATKYLNRKWHETADSFTATESKVYGFTLEFDDTYIVP